MGKRTHKYEENEVIKLRRQYLSYKEIAQKLGKPQSTVKGIILRCLSKEENREYYQSHRSGSKKKRADITVKAIIRLENKGLNRAEIARHFGCSDALISQKMSGKKYPKHRGCSGDSKPVNDVKPSNRKCLVCGKDPAPNYFYCPSCHNGIDDMTESKCAYSGLIWR